jgi:hypothetical protein
VLTGEPASVAVAAIVIVAVAPSARSPSAHTTGSPWVQIPRELLTERTVTPAGTESVTTASTAVEGPALRTVSV